jgi:hypothetical protein
MMKYGIVLFHTTSAVMRAEKLLLKERVSIKLIPTPREFSSDCGIALRFEWNQHEQVKSVLNNADVEIAAIHQM